MKLPIWSRSLFSGSSIRGFSLVEVMIAGAIFALLGSAVASFMGRQSQTMQAMRYVATRDSFKNKLSITGASPNALKTSIQQPENAALKKCITGEGCQPKVFVPFALYDSLGAKLAGAGASSPMRFTIDGMRCAAKSAKCPMEVFSEIAVTCRDGDSRCISPIDVQIRYTIRQAPGVRIPGSAELKKEQGDSAQVDVNAIKAVSASKAVGCYENGLVMRGILPDGKADCVPIFDPSNFRVQSGEASKLGNPNPAGGEWCGWDTRALGLAVRMKHVTGTVCCGAGELALGGGAVCNHGAGGYLESSKLIRDASGRACWFVDCCKYSPYNKVPSPLWVQCVAAPGVDLSKMMPK
jgi:prepilin-type N-terminal cleavage/methylation domain-containing protein